MDFLTNVAGQQKNFVRLRTALHFFWWGSTPIHLVFVKLYKEPNTAHPWDNSTIFFFISTRDPQSTLCCLASLSRNVKRRSHQDVCHPHLNCIFSKNAIIVMTEVWRPPQVLTSRVWCYLLFDPSNWKAPVGCRFFSCVFRLGREGGTSITTPLLL